MTPSTKRRSSFARSCSDLTYVFTFEPKESEGRSSSFEMERIKITEERMTDCTVGEIVSTVLV